MEYEFTKFTDAVASVHYSGQGSMRSLSINVPDGCIIHIGGEGAEAYSIRGNFMKGQESIRYMEMPPVMLACDIHLEKGTHRLTVSSTSIDDKAAVLVEII